MSLGAVSALFDCHSLQQPFASHSSQSGSQQLPHHASQGGQEDQAGEGDQAGEEHQAREEEAELAG